MPGYAPVNPLAGFGPTDQLMVPDTTQRFAGGQVLDAVDPYFGWGRFIYLQSGAAYDPGTLVTVVDQTFLTQVLGATANLGQNFYVVRQVMSAANVWGWFQMEGIAPVRVDTGVAAYAAIGMGSTPGRAGTNGAGKQLLGVTVLKAATFTLTKVGQTYNGQTYIDFSNVSGLFKGLAMTGTGLGASTVVSTLDPSGTRVNGTVASTATASVTVTFTWTGYNMLLLGCPHTQGAIT